MGPPGTGKTKFGAGARAAMLSLDDAVAARRFRYFAVRFAFLAGIALVIGFGFFLRLLPSEEVALKRNADGIVVLTGGTARVSDALELLAAHRGKRLLITGVNPGTTTTDIARQVPTTTASSPAASTSITRRSIRSAMRCKHAAGRLIEASTRSSL